jgi:lambda family phage portal protein
MSQAREITVNGRKISVPVTLADRVVNFFSPSAGAARFNARARMAISGGYTSADKSRRANQRGSRRETDADGAILPDLITLREDSQHLVRNSPLACGAINTNVTKVVGTGLKVKSQIDRDYLGISDAAADAWELSAEREFKLATETVEIDLERQQTFAQLQALAFLKVLEDGDIFVNLPRKRRPGSPYKLKLQLIEAARVCNPEGKADSGNLTAGVEKDVDGAPLAYRIAKFYPGSFRSYKDRTEQDWQRLEAFGRLTGSPLVLHLMDKRRPGQTRGVPYLAPVIELIKQLGRYTDAEVMAAVVSGMMTVFITSETGDALVGDPAEADDPYDTTGMELGHGSVIGLRPGTKIDSFDPNRPNTAFDPFIQAVLRQIGVALELPFEILIKHFTSSYSAARAALLEAWAYFRRRRAWLVTVLCQPIYEQIITEAVATGRLQAPGFFADPLTRKAWLGTLWIGDAPGQIDPLKEANAAKVRLHELRITTHDEECAAYDGSDWEQKFPRIVANHEALRDAGLTTVESAAQPEEESEEP